jgi:hypothetical protein
MKGNLSHQGATIQSHNLAAVPLPLIPDKRPAHLLRSRDFTISKESIEREFANVSLGNPKQEQSRIICHDKAVFLIH